MVLIGLDPGNGETKITTTSKEGETFVFPSITAGYISKKGFAVQGRQQNPEEYITLKIKEGKEEKEYTAGKLALASGKNPVHQTKDSKYTSEEAFLLTRAALSLATNPEDREAKMIIGLPLHMMKQAETIEAAYIRNFSGHYFGTSGDYEKKARNLNIEEVVAVSQQRGTYFDLLWDGLGNIAHPDLVKKGLGIFDIGYRTIDGEVFRNLDPISRADISSKNGMQVAYREIMRRVNSTIQDANLKEYEVPDLIKDPYLKGHNLTSIIEEEMYSLALLISADLQQWDSVKEVDTVVFTGGGAEALRPYLEQLYPNAIFKGQTSNVNGFLKYAKQMWGQE